MPTEWQDRLDAERAKASVRIRQARAFHTRYRAPLERHRGGMPSGFLAAIAEFESGGRMIAGDASLGEFGFYQVTESTPKNFGLDPETRKTPTGNIFLAALEYNVLARRLARDFPQIVEGSRDNWMLARLGFAVGAAGARKLIEGALARTWTGGEVYPAVIRYADMTDGVRLGSQSSGKVWFRVQVIPLLWEIGQAVQPSAPTHPKEVPAPPGLAYRLPKDVRGTFQAPGGGTGTLLAAAGLLLLLA